jgi:hypothetical protein
MPTASTDAASRLALGIVCWVAQVVLAAVGSAYLVLVRPMGMGQCAPTCDYGLLGAATWGCVGVALVLIGISIMVVVETKKGGAALAALAITGVAFIVANLVMGAALGY